jgi:hypothetical protein
MLLFIVAFVRCSQHNKNGMKHDFSVNAYYALTIRCGLVAF